MFSKAAKVTLVLSYSVKEILDLLCAEIHFFIPSTISAKISGVPLVVDP